MSALSLQIIQPTNGVGSSSAVPVTLQATLTGDPAGLFFKWFSSLNSAATEDHPELNTTNHSSTILNWSSPLAEFGSHTIVLAATDQDGINLPSVKAVTRSAMAGGALPAAPLPCVIHRLKAQIRTPSADGQVLSKAVATTLELLAPVRWAKEEPPSSGTWVADLDYQLINGITLALRFAPAGAPDPAHSADIPLVLASLPFFRADDQTWFRWTGVLPANLMSGPPPPDPTASNYTLTLTVTGGGASTSATRQVFITA